MKYQMFEVRMELMVQNWLNVLAGNEESFGCQIQHRTEVYHLFFTRILQFIQRSPPSRIS